MTEIRFSVPLDSGDSTDNSLAPGKRHRVIFAFGKGDGFETSHAVESEAVGFIIL